MLHSFFFRGGGMAEKDAVMLRQKELNDCILIHEVPEEVMTRRGVGDLPLIHSTPPRVSLPARRSVLGMTVSGAGDL